MQRDKKKTKYIQKTLFPQMKSQIIEQVHQKKPIKYVQKQHKQLGEAKTTVVNVKVAQLRQNGYHSLIQWLQDDQHVYIGRQNAYVQGAKQSQWANPFKVNDYGRYGCIQRYKEYLLCNPQKLAGVKKLKGKVLGCWCAPDPCHGQILAELADSSK